MEVETGTQALVAVTPPKKNFRNKFICFIPGEVPGTQASQVPLFAIHLIHWSGGNLIGRDVAPRAQG